MTKLAIFAETRLNLTLIEDLGSYFPAGSIVVATIGRLHGLSLGPDFAHPVRDLSLGLGFKRRPSDIDWQIMRDRWAECVEESDLAAVFHDGTFAISELQRKLSRDHSDKIWSIQDGYLAFTGPANLRQEHGGKSLIRPLAKKLSSPRPQPPLTMKFGTSPIRNYLVFSEEVADWLRISKRKSEVVLYRFPDASSEGSLRSFNSKLDLIYVDQPFVEHGKLSASAWESVQADLVRLMHSHRVGIRPHPSRPRGWIPDYFSSLARGSAIIPKGFDDSVVPLAAFSSTLAATEHRVGRKVLALDHPIMPELLPSITNLLRIDVKSSRPEEMTSALSSATGGSPEGWQRQFCPGGASLGEVLRDEVLRRNLG